MKNCDFTMNLQRSIEEEVLEYFNKENNDGYEWSEQDIYEQMRKIIQKYE